MGDFNGDKSQDFYYSIRNGNKTEIFLFQQNFGLFENVAPEQGISHTGFDEDAHFADIDNNGHLDLIVTNNQGIRFYSNGGEGKFTDISEESELSTVSGGDKILAADFDHDGDLDIYIGRQGPNQMFRNNMNGSFNEMAHKMKMGGLADSKDLGFGDFDNDGDLDIFVINSNGEHNLLSNLRQGQFEDLIVINPPEKSIFTFIFFSQNVDSVIIRMKKCLNLLKKLSVMLVWIGLVWSGLEKITRNPQAL